MDDRFILRYGNKKDWVKNMRHLTLLLLFILLAGLSPDVLFAAPIIVYHSTLDNSASVSQPAVGPAGQWIPASPTFVTAYKGMGMRAADTSINATGGYQFAATGMIGSEGCLQFYLKLLDNCGTADSMPVLFASQDGKITGQMDLRSGTQRFACAFGSANLSAETSWWVANQFHHVAISWSLSGGWVRLYVDNVLLDSQQITQVPSVTAMAVNCRLDIPGHQANFCTAIDDLKIWNNGAITDFTSEVPAAWTQATSARTQPQQLEEATDAGLYGVPWAAEGTAAESVQIVPVGTNAVALKMNYSTNTWFTIRPTRSIPLRNSDKWLIFYAHQFSLGNVEMFALVKGQDGVERQFVVSVGAGRGWRQCLSAYIGGIRSDLASMRPGDAQSPSGDSPPLQLTGLKIRSTLYGSGICYLRDLRATNHDFITGSRWRVWTYRDKLDLVGGIEEDACAVNSTTKVGRPFVFVEDLLADSEDQAPLSTRMWALYECPVLPPGSYKVQLEVTNRYQGAASFRMVQDFDYNPADLVNTYASRFSLPVTDGTYWLDTKVWTAAGDWVAGWRTCYTMDGTGDQANTAPARSIPSKKPGISLLSLATTQPENIFDSPSTPQVLVRAWRPNGLGSVTLQWQIEESWARLLLPVTSGSTTLNFSDQYADYTVPISGATRTTAYVVTVKVLNGNRVLDQEKIIVGARFPEATKQPAPGLATLSSLVLSGPLFSSASDQWLKAPDPANLRNSYLSELQWTSQMTQSWTGTETIQRVDVPWSFFEPLPGLYCFGAPDDKVARLKLTGASMQMALTSHQAQEPNWLPRECMQNQYGCWNWGSAHEGSNYVWELSSFFYASGLGPSWDVRQGMAWEALSNHYLQETSVKAYMTWTIQSFFDNLGMITDYSEYARQGFGQYLQNTLAMSLSQANARYGTNWTSWSQAQLPQSKSGEPDLTDAWRDFTACKQSVIRHGIFDMCVNRLRAKGDTRPVFFYHENSGGSIEEYWPDCAAKGAVICAGWGEDYPSDYASHVAGYLQNSPYSSEPHPASIGPDPKRVDNIFAGALSAGGAGFVFHHYFTRETLPGQEASLDRMAQWATAIRSLGRAEPQLMDIGFYHGGGNGLSGKSFNSYISLTGWGALESWYKDHCLPTYISPYTGHDRLSRMKLLIPAHYLLKQSDVTAIKNYVLGGGKVFLMGPYMGSYCYERPTEKYVLIRELGWTDTSVFNEAITGSCTANLNTSFFTHVSSLSLYSTQPTANFSLPAGATVLGTFSNGRPAVVRWSVGAGEVIACVRQIPWWLTGGTATYQTDLRAWAGVPDRLGLATPNNEILLNEFMNGSTRYLLVTRRGSSSTDTVTVQARIYDLPAGNYTVTELGPRAGNIGTMTAAQFAEGLSVDLTERELRLFRITPTP